jgi:hypothetical protein
MESEDNYIVLMLDANEDVNDGENGLRKLIEKTTLLDAFSEFTGETCKLSTYVNGNKRLDYILTSTNLVPFIERVGYTPFYGLNTRDHCGVFIDITSSLIDHKIELSRPATRHIGSKSKGKDIFNYKMEVHKQFNIHRIYDRIQELFSKSLIEDNNTLFEYQLNSIDQQVTEIMIAAEMKKGTRRHESEWSIELHNTSLMCLYWTKQYKGIKNGVLVTRQVKTIWNKLPTAKKQEINEKLNNDDDSMPMLMKISKENMKYYLAYKRELIRHNTVLRQKGLKHLKEIRIAEGNVKQAAIIEKIYTNKMTKHDWAVVKNKLRPVIRSGISTVEIPDKDRMGNSTDDSDKAITWKRLTDPSDIEDRLLERNIVKHFGQANETLFASEDFQEEFQYEGISAAVDRLLDGEYNIDNANVSKGARTLLEKLGDGQKLPRLKDGVSYEEFTKGIKKWSEGTSTSPSGRHLGHYRCLFVNDECEDLYDEIYKDPKDNIHLKPESGLFRIPNWRVVGFY